MAAHQFKQLFSAKLYNNFMRITPLVNLHFVHVSPCLFTQHCEDTVNGDVPCQASVVHLHTIFCKLLTINNNFLQVHATVQSTIWERCFDSEAQNGNNACCLTIRPVVDIKQFPVQRKVNTGKLYGHSRRVGGCYVLLPSTRTNAVSLLVVYKQVIKFTEFTEASSTTILLAWVDTGLRHILSTISDTYNMYVNVWNVIIKKFTIHKKSRNYMQTTQPFFAEIF